LLCLFLQVKYIHNSDAAKFVNSGLESEKNGNYEEAVFYYSMAVETDPNYADAYLTGAAFIAR